MPLRDGYGVLIGQYERFTLDDINNPGLYYHGHIHVRAPARVGTQLVSYDCAVDVNQFDQNIEYCTFRKINTQILAPIIGLADGYHSLLSTSGSGALDYVRNKYISEPLGCAAIFVAILRTITGKNTQVWKNNLGGSALTELQDMLTDIEKVFIYGAPFRNNGNGMHDIHFNQGNSRPDRSDPRFNTGNPQEDQKKFNQEMGWFLNNGIWQDGAVLLLKTSGQLEGFLVKFVVQSMNTDTNGNPL
jgi:hypothetical protein